MEDGSQEPKEETESKKEEDEEEEIPEVLHIGDGGSGWVFFAMRSYKLKLFWSSPIWAVLPNYKSYVHIALLD